MVWALLLEGCAVFIQLSSALAKLTAELGDVGATQTVPCAPPGTEPALGVGVAGTRGKGLLGEAVGQADRWACSGLSDPGAALLTRRCPDDTSAPAAVKLHRDDPVRAWQRPPRLWGQKCRLGACAVETDAMSELTRL